MKAGTATIPIEKMTIGVIGLILALPLLARADEQMIDAESFTDTGGWVVDQQSMDQMGSPYLMAHGLGEKGSGRPDA